MSLDGGFRIIGDDDSGGFPSPGVCVRLMGLQVSEFDVVSGFVASLKPLQGTQSGVGSGKVAASGYPSLSRDRVVRRVAGGVSRGRHSCCGRQNAPPAEWR